MITYEEVNPAEKTEDFRGVLIVESNGIDSEWLKEISEDVRLKFIRCHEGGAAALLNSFGPTVPTIIAPSFRGSYRKNSQHEVDRILEMFKNRPTIGVLVESEGSRMISKGRCSWVSRSDAKERILQLINQLESNSSEFFEANRVLRCDYATDRTISPKAAARTLLPNINIKHPGMALGVANVVKRLNVTGWIEISPFEAAYYYDLPMNSKRILPLAEKTLRRLRDDVDEIRRITGADLRLHLDHAHDQNLIAASLDAGFDSVMADGSSRSLEANIRLVSSVKKRAEKYGVPVEAEIGDLDSSAPRRFAHTEPEDVKRFLDAVVPDYLAVCVGQDHSSDYGFERMRNALFEINEIDLEHLHSGRRCLFDACSLVDFELEELGFGLKSSSREVLSRIRDALFEPDLAVEQIIEEAERNSCLPDLRWISRLRVVSSELRLKVERTRLEQFDSALGVGNKDSLKPESPRLLDRTLLSKINKLCRERGALTVLHGGSSIDQKDLQTLPLDVARVNFGTNAFMNFAGSILSRRPAYENSNTRSHLAAILREEASDWRDWLEKPPPFLRAFESSLEREFFDPLNKAHDLKKG